MPNIDLTGINLEHIKASKEQKGYEASPNTIDTTESQYYKGFIVPDEDPYGALNEWKAQHQPWEDKLANGITKAGLTAITSATESLVGLPVGLMAMAAGQGFFDNSFTRTLDDISKWSQEALPNYYTQAEQEASVVENMFGAGAANFWGDKFANGLGYMVGAMAAGYGLNKFASLSRLMATTRGEVETLRAVEQGLTKWDKAYKITNGIDFAKNAMIMSMGESGVEARGVLNNVRDKMTREYLAENGLSDESQIPADVKADIEARAVAAGNAAWLGNMVVTSIENAFMFPKIVGGKYLDDVAKINEVKRLGMTEAVQKEADLAFSTAKSEAIAAGKTADEALAIANDAKNQIIKSKALKLTAETTKPWVDRAARFGSGVAAEGAQEGAQFAIEKGFTDYYSSKYNPEVGASISDIVTALSDGVSETLGTKEGWESIILGALLGGPSKVLTTRGERAAKEAQTQKVIDLVNGEDFYKLSKSIEQLHRYQTAAKDKEQAAMMGDAFEYQNADFKATKAFIRRVVDAGGTDVLLDQLDAISDMSKDEFKSLMGYSNKTTTDRTVKDNIDVIKNTVTKLKKEYDIIEKQFINPFDFKTEPVNYKKFEDYKHRLWDYSTDMINLDERHAKVLNELGNNPVTAKVALTYEALRDFREKFSKLPAKEQKELLKEKNRLVREKNEAVRELKEKHPNVATEVTPKLRDLKRIRERRDKVIASYNALINFRDINEIVNHEDPQSPEAKVKKAVFAEGKTKEDFRQELKDSGYDVENHEDFSVEIDGKVKQVKWNGKDWVINGVPFGEVYNERKGHRVVSKEELKTREQERVENIKRNIRERQLKDLITEVSKNRDNVYNRILNSAAIKLSKLQEVDRLLNELQDPKLKPQAAKKIANLINAIQKDVFILEDSIAEDNSKLEQYDRQIAQLELQLQADSSIDSVIQDLEIARQQRDHLANQIEETNGLISKLKKIIRDLKAVFFKLFPYAKQMFDGFTFLSEDGKSIEYKDVITNPEVVEAALEIESKKDALTKLQNTLQELETEKADVEAKIKFLEGQVNQYNKELGDILEGNKKRMPANQMDNANQIDTSENTEEDLKNIDDENRQTRKAKTSFFTTAGIHMLFTPSGLEKETDNVDDKRWFRAIANLPKPNAETEYFVRFFTADDPELGKYFSEDDKQFEDNIKVLLVNEKGEPILVDGLPLFRSINTENFIYNEELVNKGDLKNGIKVSHNALIATFIKDKTGVDGPAPSTIDKYTIDGVEYSRNQLIVEGAKLAHHQVKLFRGRIVDDLKAGKKVYSAVTGIVSGVPNKMYDSQGNPIRNKISAVLDKIVQVFIPMPVSVNGVMHKKVTIPGKDGVFLAGSVYVQDANGNIINTLNRNLRENEQQLIIDLLDYSLNTGSESMNKRIKISGSDKDAHIFIDKNEKDQSIISKLIYYGPDKEGKSNPRRIYFQSGRLYFGDKSIPTSEIKTSQEFREFLKDLRLNVNKNLLGTANKYYAPRTVFKNKDGVMELQFKGFDSYESYLVEEEVITTNLPTKESNIPQFVQGHVKFSSRLTNELEEPKETKQAEPSKEEPKTEITEATFEDMTSGKPFTAKRVVGDIAQEITVEYRNGEFVATALKNNGQSVEVSAGVNKFMKNLTEEIKSAEDLNEIKQSEVYINNKVEFLISKDVQNITSSEKAKVEESVSDIERRTIQMQPDNIKKILDGTKTTTTRSESQAKQINISIGKSAIVNFGGQDFKVTNRGLLTIDEAGGKEAIEKSENFENNTPKYQQTKDWLNGKGKLYVYDIVKYDAELAALEAEESEEQGFFDTYTAPVKESNDPNYQTLKEAYNNWKNDPAIASILEENNLSLDELYKEYTELNSFIPTSITEYISQVQMTKLNC